MLFLMNASFAEMCLSFALISSFSALRIFYKLRHSLSSVFGALIHCCMKYFKDNWFNAWFVASFFADACLNGWLDPW